MGSASSPLEQFLLNSLSEASLKKIQKTVDLTCVDLSTLLTDHVRHHGEHLFYRLTELNSLSKWFFFCIVTYNS
jgi:hypothetical protein